MNRKKIQIGVLLLVAAAVWGNNLYRIFTGVFQADEVPTAVETSMKPSAKPFAAAHADTQKFVYAASVRDPFAHRLASPKKKAAAPKRKPPSAPVVLPKLRLNGVIRDDDGVLAIIETASAVLFARKGDMIDDVSIVRIDSGRVELRFKRKTFFLEMR